MEVDLETLFEILYLFWWRGDIFKFEYQKYYPCEVADEIRKGAS